MNKIGLFAIFLAMGLSAVAQTADPVIMKINGKNITRSEFEYSFNKNNSEGVLDKKTVEEYVPLYVDFKLKVGLVLTEERLAELKKASEFGKLYQRALEWVLVRPRSEREVRDYLKRRERTEEMKTRQREWMSRNW